MSLRDRLKRLFVKPAPPRCDTCAFVEFFRSNGDGQTSRLNGFCRCPDGPYVDRLIPVTRCCPRWQLSPTPVVKPVVGDPDLTV